MVFAIMKKLFTLTRDDFQIDYFSGTGAGGQHRNKHQNCVRLKHNDSGVSVTGQSHRERKSNIKEALTNLKNHPQFRLWINRRVYEIDTGKSITEIVDEQMNPKNIKVEMKDEQGVWIEDI